MGIEQIELAGVATHKSYRRIADWAIALLVVTGACIALAVWLVGDSSEIGTTGTATATFSADATADARALNQPAVSEAPSATFTLPGVRDARSLNASTDRYMEAVRDFRALNEAQYRASALNIAGVEDARTLNQPSESYRFMPTGPGR